MGWIGLPLAEKRLRENGWLIVHHIYGLDECRPSVDLSEKWAQVLKSSPRVYCIRMVPPIQEEMWIWRNIIQGRTTPCFKSDILKRPSWVAVCFPLQIKWCWILSPKLRLYNSNIIAIFCSFVHCHWFPQIWTRFWTMWTVMSLVQKYGRLTTAVEQCS